MILRAVLGLALALGLPAQALAEGARISVTCQVTSSCDAGGQCTATRQPFDFTLDPVDVGPDGAGDFRITIAGAGFDAEVTADRTVTWAGGAETWNQLVFAAEPHVIWTARRAGPAPEAQIRFLSCETQL